MAFAPFRDKVTGVELTGKAVYLETTRSKFQITDDVVLFWGGIEIPIIQMVYNIHRGDQVEVECRMNEGRILRFFGPGLAEGADPTQPVQHLS